MRHFNDRTLCTALMACRNSSSYIEESLLSFLNQNVSNIDMVVVDDFSDDDSVHKIEKFISENNTKDRINIIKLDKQHGCAEARNHGIEKAKGSYVAIWDSDDFYEYERIDTTIKHMKDYDLDVCGTWANVVDAKGDMTGKFSYPPLHHEQILWMLPSKRNPMIDPSCIVKKQSLIIAGCWTTDRNINLAPDLDLWFRMSKAGMRFGNIDSYLTNYRVQSNSNTVAKNKEMIKHHVEVVRRHYGKVELTRHEQYTEN